MTMQIYVPTGHIELDGEWTQLHARQDKDGTTLYLGEDTKFGFFRFDLKKKRYVLSFSQHQDFALFESEVRNAYETMKKAETLVKDWREEGFDDKQIADTLCDGEALANLGITDQTLVELAYSLVEKRK